MYYRGIIFGGLIVGFWRQVACWMRTPCAAFLPSFGDPCGDQTSRGDVASRSLNLLYFIESIARHFTLGKLFNVGLYHEVQVP